MPNHSAFEFQYPDLTKNSVGLDQVDNTSDANKPLSTAAVTALAGKQPLDSDLTAIAALTTTSIGRSLLAAIDAAALRTILGLGTAATSNTSAFDASGAAAAAQAASQPLDSDLTAIAALSTTSFGRAFLILADAAAGRTYLGLGTAATQASTAFDAAGSAAAAQAASQPLDSDLTAIAALATTSFGRSLLTQIDAAAVKTLLALNNVNNTADSAKTFDASQVTSGVFNIARLASGTPNGTKFVRDDGTLAVPPGGGGGSTTLAALTDVDVATDPPAQDDLLAYNSVTGKWTPASLSGTVRKPLSAYVIPAATTVTTGDGKAYIRIPPALDGMKLAGASIAVMAPSTSGTPTVQIARGRQSSPTSAHSYVDMLSTALTIDANEYDSKDAATAGVVDAANATVATGDLIRIDVDVAGTGTAGLVLTATFGL